MTKIFVITVKGIEPATSKRPGCYHSASKTQVKDRIFKLTPIHASVIYQIPCIRWIHWKFCSFRKNSIEPVFVSLRYWEQHQIDIVSVIVRLDLINIQHKETALNQILRNNRTFPTEVMVSMEFTKESFSWSDWVLCFLVFSARSWFK